jgi:hypothetical protein
VGGEGVGQEVDPGSSPPPGASGSQRAAVKPHTELLAWVRALTFQLLEDISMVRDGAAEQVLYIVQE